MSNFSKLSIKINRVYEVWGELWDVLKLTNIHKTPHAWKWILLFCRGFYGNTDIVIVNTRIITALVRCLILVALYSQYVSCKLLYVSSQGPHVKTGRLWKETNCLHKDAKSNSGGRSECHSWDFYCSVFVVLCVDLLLCVFSRGALWILLAKAAV